MASDDAKPASPAAADPPADDAKDNSEPETKADAEPEVEKKQQEEEKTPQQPERKRGRRKKGEAEAGKKTPPSKKLTPGIERPSRERKTVERYSELAPRVTPVKKSPAILQGSGTKLKDIPNVSFKLSKRKVDENLQSLHTLMYGKKSNVRHLQAHFLKRNISQFSGFVWTDNQEKHRNRIKEKLDKFNKEKLLDFCEILDIHVSKATTKKEEVSAKLLEFLESPCITRDVVLTDDKFFTHLCLLLQKKRRWRSKGNAQATSEGATSDKKRKRGQKEAAEVGKENDAEDEAGSGSEDASMGEADGGSEANDAVSDEESDEPPKKKSTDVKQVKKEAESKAKEKDTPKKPSTKPAKGASKPSEDTKDIKKVGRRAKSSKENDVPVDSNKTNKKVSKSKKDEAQNSKASTKDGAKLSNKNKGNRSVLSYAVSLIDLFALIYTNKYLSDFVLMHCCIAIILVLTKPATRAGKGKGGADAGSAPTTEQLHAVVSTILKEVDFNTATLADILRQLGTHFNMDLMDRKAEVKRIIEEVINSMSDDEDGDDNSEDEAEGNGKAENSKDGPKGGEEK
ncbi:hypothetical protein PR202_ga08445 [Eleusine coracana subsp. coracana]|uniref:DEK-C domain-containing protein n=1 Tax=Eleusine coracana subsp. coracana TaxID=191504 RepID=A0AAV5C3A4_ELECO|nr:hypothetical protein PR202_ga08445 [Eleusine coracana subsp. coracana]